MKQAELNWISGYIWGIADDLLRDLYVRGKYRDVILPMTLLRRLDAVLEDSKQAVLDLKATLDAAGVVARLPDEPDEEAWLDDESADDTERDFKKLNGEREEAAA